MADFYVLNGVPTIEARDANAAALAYARENKIDGGVVLVAADVEKFDVSTTVDLSVTPRAK